MPTRARFRPGFNTFLLRQKFYRFFPANPDDRPLISAKTTWKPDLDEPDKQYDYHNGGSTFCRGPDRSEQEAPVSTFKQMRTSRSRRIVGGEFRIDQSLELRFTVIRSVHNLYTQSVQAVRCGLYTVCTTHSRLQWRFACSLQSERRICVEELQVTASAAPNHLESFELYGVQTFVCRNRHKEISGRLNETMHYSISDFRTCKTTAFSVCSTVLADDL